MRVVDFTLCVLGSAEKRVGVKTAVGFFPVDLMQNFICCVVYGSDAAALVVVCKAQRGAGFAFHAGQGFVHCV